MTDGGSSEKDLRGWARQWLKNKKDSKNSKEKKKEKVKLLKENKRRLEVQPLTFQNLPSHVTTESMAPTSITHQVINSDPHSQIQI